MGSSASRMAETSSETDCSSSRPIPPSLSTNSRTWAPEGSRFSSTSTSSNPRAHVTRSAIPFTASLVLACASLLTPKKRVGLAHSGASPRAGTESIAGEYGAYKDALPGPLDACHEVVSLRLGDRGRYEATRLGGAVVEDHRPIDLGGLAGGAALQQQVALGVRPLHQHLQALAHAAAVPPGHQPLLLGHQPAPARLLRPARDPALEAVGRGALLVGVGEHPDVVELRVAHEAQELLEVGLGLPGEADDERAPQRDPRRSEERRVGKEGKSRVAREH